MKPAEKTLALALAVGMVIGLIIWGPAEHSVQAAEQTGETSRNVELATPTWSGGAAVGFLSNTPDGTAFAFNLHADRFLQRNVSLGPLVQLGFTGDLTQVGFSGQGKY
jgi:glucose uptake protein GlcU